MDQTARLSLPFIMPSQAQKHITHNEALQALDALVQPTVESCAETSPPALPLEGEGWIVGVAATGGWSGHDGEVAVWQSGAWTFLDPSAGWQVYSKTDHTHYVYDGSWKALASLGAGLPRLGVNTTSDTTNRFAVSADATLLTHAGSNHQLKLNKNAAGDTASLLYQTNWSGRAEMGLAGDDNWRLKVSLDGQRFDGRNHCCGFHPSRVRQCLNAGCIWRTVVSYLVGNWNNPDFRCATEN